MPSFSDQSNKTEDDQSRSGGGETDGNHLNLDWVDWYKATTSQTSVVKDSALANDAGSEGSGLSQRGGESELTAFRKCYQECGGWYNRSAHKEMFDNLSLKLSNMGLHLSTSRRNRLAAAYLKMGRVWSPDGKEEDVILQAICDWQAEVYNS